MNVALRSLILFCLGFYLSIYVYFCIVSYDATLPLENSIKPSYMRNSTSIVNIFVDWEYLPDELSYIHYKCLESLLWFNPRARVEMTILCSHSCNYYPPKSIISKHHFLKYHKIGLSFDAVINHNLASFYKKDFVLTNTSYFEDSFFDKEISRVLSKTGMINDMVFDSVVLLFKATQAVSIRKSSFNLLIERMLIDIQGGIYLDLAWFLTAPLDSLNISEGVLYQEICAPDHSHCANGTILIFRYPKSPVVQCTLDELETPNSDLRQCLRDLNTPVCIIDSLTRCFQSNQVQNELENLSVEEFSPNCRCSKDQTGNILVARYQDSLFHMQSCIKSNLINRTPLMIWTEIAFPRKEWRIPSSSSWLGQMIAKIKLNGFVEQHPEETRTPTASIASFSCQPYSISYENISSLPNRQRDRLMSQSSCSPRFVIPGFMKAGSSYLYDLITSHPRALKALRGVAFKETGCYDPHFLKTIPATSRIECFPFVERHEAFFFGDATVTYSTKRSIAFNLYQDNKDLKVLFITRNPIERLRSHHNFMYPTLARKKQADLNILILSALSQQPKFWKMHQLAEKLLLYQDDRDLWNSSLLKDLIALYYSPVPNSKSLDYHYGCMFLSYSIYVVPILSYASVFPLSQIYVTSLEIFMKKTTKTISAMPSHLSLTNAGWLSNRSSLEELRSIYMFLNVSVPASAFLERNIRTIGQHDSPKRIPSAQHELNGTTHALLIRYYQPFQRLERRLILTRTLMSSEQSELADSLGK